MKLIQTHKGRTEKVVTIDNEGEANPSRREAFQFALAVTGETVTSIFGYDVRQSEMADGTKVTVVSLYID